MISDVLAMVGVSTRSGTATVIMIVPTAPMRMVAVSCHPYFIFLVGNLVNLSV